MINERAAKGPKKHSPVCYQLTRDIVIPAGTMLRHASDKRGGVKYVECPIGHGKDFTSHLVVELCLAADESGDFKKVISA